MTEVTNYPVMVYGGTCIYDRVYTYASAGIGYSTLHNDSAFTYFCPLGNNSTWMYSSTKVIHWQSKTLYHTLPGNIIPYGDDQPILFKEIEPTSLEERIPQQLVTIGVIIEYSSHPNSLCFEYFDDHFCVTSSAVDIHTLDISLKRFHCSTTLC